MDFTHLESEIAELVDGKSEKPFIIKVRMNKDLGRVVKNLWKNHKGPAKILKAQLKKSTITVELCPSKNPQDIYWAYLTLKEVGFDYWQLVNT